MRGQRASLRDVAVISEWKVTPGEEDFIDFRADLRSGFGRAAHRYYSVREFRELRERRRSWLHLDCTFCTIGVLGSALLSREIEQRQGKLWERTWIWDRYAHAYAFVSPAREHLSDT